MRSSAIRLVLIAAAASIALAACQQLFTTSLASALARPSLPIPAKLSATQANDLAAEAKANADPVLATALVSSLKSQIEAATDTTVKDSLMAASASAAVTASGAGSTIMTVFNDVASGTAPSSATITSLVQTIQAGASESVVEALSYLEVVTPAAAEAAGFSGTDYFVAAAVVTASVLEAASITSDPTADTATTQAAIQAAVDADTTGALQAKIDVAIALANAGADILVAQDNTMAVDLQAQLAAFLSTGG